MLDLQAAIGIHQLDKLEDFNSKRDFIAKTYNNAFSSIDSLHLPPVGSSESRHAWHIYPVQFDVGKLKKDRETIMNELKKENIGTGVHYLAIHLHPFFTKALGYPKGSFPHSELVSDRVLSLPLFPKMTDQDVLDVIQAVQKIVG